MKIVNKLILSLLSVVMCPLSLWAQEKLIVVNEGIWQSNNGRLTYLSNGSIVSNQWFRDVNKTNLGDTPSDIIQVNDNLIAIALNWSNIVQFITPEGKAVAATEDIPNNRKLASDGKYVYVTSYAHECRTVDGYKYFTKGFVAKIDISNFKVVAAVETGYEPEGIIFYGGYLFVANTGGYAFQESHAYEKTVSIIDASTMTVTRTVDTGQINLYGKMSVSGQYLCINSPGDYYDTMAATVIFDCKAALEGKSDKDCRVILPLAATYSCVDAEKNFIAVGSRYSYYDGDYKFNYVRIDPRKIMETNGADGVYNDLPGTVLKDLKAMSMPYGIYVNPYTGYIYATDAGSYSSSGTLYQWNPEGVLQNKYRTYINPAHFLALPPDGHFTAIESVIAEESSENTNHATYNLMGVKVSKLVPGQIYIRDRKKFLFQ